MHPALRRQLNEVGLDVEDPPDGGQWRRFLDGLEHAFDEAAREGGRQEELEHAVHEREERYKNLMDAVPEVIFSLSVVDGSLTSLSRAFETLSWVLSPEGPNDVHLLVEAIYTPAGGFAGVVLDVLLQRAHRRQALRDAVWRLKHLLEGHGPGDGPRPAGDAEGA